MLAGWEQSTKALSVKKWKKKKKEKNCISNCTSYFNEIFYIRKEGFIWHQQCSDLCIFPHFQIKIVLISEIYFQMQSFCLVFVTAIRMTFLKRHTPFEVLYIILIYPASKESLLWSAVSELKEDCSTPVW